MKLSVSSWKIFQEQWDSYLVCYKAALYHSWKNGFCSQMDLGFSPEFSMSCLVISLYLCFLIYKIINLSLWS